MAHAGEFADSKIDAATLLPATAASAIAGGPPGSPASPAPSASVLSSGELSRLVARGGAWSLGISVAGAALSLGVHLLLARALGSEEYGRYVFALAWMNVLALLGKFELDTATVRFVGAYAATEQWSFLRGFLRRSTQIVGGASLAISFLGATIVLVLMHRLDRGTALSLLAASILLPIAAMGQLRASVLQGFKKVARAQTPTMIIRPIIFALGIVAVRALAAGALSAPVAITLQIGATSVALVLTIRLLQPVLPTAVRTAGESFDTRYWLTTAAGLLVISGGQIIVSTNSDVLVVGSLLDAESAGHYSAASQIASAVSFGISAISFIALPMIADLYAKDAIAKLQDVIRQVARLGLLLSVPVLLILVVAAKIVLRTFGPTFVSASDLLILLSFDQLVGVIFGIAGYLLVMTGHQITAARVIVGCAALNLALTFVLTPVLGIMGAGLATTITTLARSYLLTRSMRLALGLSLAPWGEIRPAS